MYKGMLVTFEGGDGSGKSTHCSLLEAQLKSEGIDYLITREPGGTIFSEAVRALVKDAKFADKSPISELLLFESARADIVEKVIIPALKEGKIVVLDRFYDSTTAYQGYGRGLDIEMVKALNKIATHGIVPDLTFYLRIDPETAFSRKGGAEQDDTLEQAGIEFHKRVLNGFDAIAKGEPNRFVTIDTSKDMLEAHKNIVKIFNQKYDEHTKEYYGYSKV